MTAETSEKSVFITPQVSRQAFYNYLERKGKPWKYQPLADAILEIHDEDEENADYGRVRMYQALKYRKEVGKLTKDSKSRAKYLTYADCVVRFFER